MQITNNRLSISVIIPVYNGGSSFRKCLRSLKNAIPSADEIIVVADGDTDGSWLVAKEFGAKVVRIPTSGGPARARNLGAQQATGDILFFVDADVSIPSDAISRVEKTFQKNPELTALIGSYDDAPGADNFLSQYKNLFHHYTHQMAKEEAFTFWGACGAIRRQTFLALGGFDESYRRPSIEDIELGSRLRNAGHKIMLCKDLQVKHLKDWRFVSLLRAELLYRALPWTELIWRERSLSNDLNLDTKNRLSVIIVFILIATLMASLWLHSLLAVAMVLALALFGLNVSVYRFFLHKRGFWFALRVIPWHWFYYLYGGLGFAFGTVRYFSRQQYALIPYYTSSNTDN